MISLLFHPVAASLALVVSIWPWSVLYDRRLSVRMLATGSVASVLPVLLQLALGASAVLHPTAVAVGAWSLAILLVLSWMIVRRRVDRRATGLSWRSALLTAASLLPVAAVYGVLLLVGGLVPPYGWDSLVYHLTDVFHAARVGSLEMFPFPGTVFYFPKVGELYSLWAYLLAGAGDQAWRVTGVALMPFNFLAALAVLVAVEGLGLRFMRRWIIPAMMLTPVLMIQPLSAYVDGVFAAFILAAFAFAILAARENRFSHLALCMLASGLALGTKLSFIYYCLPLLALLARGGVVQCLLGGSWPRKLGRLVACGALFLTGGGYWLLRNLFQTGNPLYPTSIRILGRTLFDGPLSIEPSTVQQAWFVDSASEWVFYPFLEMFHGVPTYTLENGFGPLFAAGFLLLPVALWIAWHRRQQTLFRALWAMPLTAFPWVMISPYVEPRYIIAICGFGLVALATVCEEAAGRTVGHDHASPSGGPAFSRGTARLIRLSLALGIVFAGLGGLASATPDLPTMVKHWRLNAWTAERFYVVHYGPTGEMFNWISQNSTSGRKVTFTNASFIAPLFGWHGKNEVVYAPISDDHRMGEALRLNSYTAWRRFLREAEVEWVVVWNPWWEGAGTDRRKGWIEAHPTHFQLVQRFAERGSIYRPYFDRAEIALLARGPRLDLERMDQPSEWTIEYQSGARTQLLGGSEAGVVIDFEFLTTGADYLDLRVDLDPWDWSKHTSLSFELEILEPSPAILVIYLKARDPAEACRYKLDISGLARGPNRVSFTLDSPEWRTAGFMMSEIAELHLVLDDIEDEARGSGRIRVGGFRVDGDSKTGK